MCRAPPISEDLHFCQRFRHEIPRLNRFSPDSVHFQPLPRVFQAMLLNDILGVERDIAEFGLAVSEDFGGLALDTTELERTLDELVGPAALV